MPSHVEYVSKCQESKMVLHVTSVRQLAKTVMLPVEMTTHDLF